MTTEELSFQPVEIGGIVREVKASNGLTYRPVPVTECKTVGQPAEGIVEAIVSVTGLVDDVQDVIEVGAYKESLAKRTPRGCWAHKWDIPVAKTLSVVELGVGHARLPTEVKALGGGGLFVTMQFNLDTTAGKDAYSNVKFFDDQQSWCADEETEILTERGWLRYDELTTLDRAYALDTNTMTASFEQVEAVNIFPAMPRRMRHIEVGGHSSLTTADHRWPVRFDDGRVGWRTTEKLVSSNAIFRTAARVDAPVEAKWSDAFVEVVGWYWTEGSKQRNALTISQSNVANPQHCGAIRAALEAAFPGGWTERFQGDDDQIVFYLRTDVVPTLEAVTGDHKEPTPEFLLSLTKAQLLLLIERALDGDGHSVKTGQRTFYQLAESGIRAFEMACALAGVPTTTHWPKDYGNRFGRVPGSVSILRNKVSKPLASIKVKRYNDKPRRTVAIDEWVTHEGIVWCPTTPSRTWLARRCNSVYFTGNSIGYQVPTGGAVFEQKTGIRRIKRLDLYEYSPVLFGAMNLASTLSVKSRFTAVGFEAKESAEAKHGTRGRPGYTLLHPNSGISKPTWTMNPDGSRTTHTSVGTPVTIHPYRGRPQHQKLAQEIAARGGWRKVARDEMRQLGAMIVYAITRGQVALGGHRNPAMVGKSAHHDHDGVGLSHDPSPLEVALIEAAMEEMLAMSARGDEVDFDPVVIRVLAELGIKAQPGKDGSDVGTKALLSEWDEKAGVGSDAIATDDDLDDELDEIDLDIGADAEAVAEVRRILDIDDSDELGWPDGNEAKAARDHSSRSHPDLDRSPKKNWVERAGGLPSYIERIAKHLHSDQGMTISHAIASAINQVKKWAAGGGGVKPATRAKAARAVAQWEALKAKNAAKRSKKGDPIEDSMADQEAWLDDLEAKHGGDEVEQTVDLTGHDELLADLEAKIAAPADAPTSAEPTAVHPTEMVSTDDPGDDHVLVEIRSTTPGWRVSVKDHEGNIHHLAHQPGDNGPPGEVEPIGPEPEREMKCAGCVEVKRHFSSAQRREMAKEGTALDDGSFPIENEEDLRNALHLVNHAKNPAKARAHIASRARAIGATRLLPDDWGSKDAGDHADKQGDISQEEYRKAGGDSATDPPTGLDGDDDDAGRTSPAEAPPADPDEVDPTETKAAGQAVNLSLRVATPGVKVRVIDGSGAVHELPIGAASGDDVADDAAAREFKHGRKGEPGYEILHPPTKADWDQARAARGKPLTPAQIEGLVNLYDEDGNFVGRASKRGARDSRIWGAASELLLTGQRAKAISDAELESKVALLLAGEDDPTEPWQLKVTAALLAQALDDTPEMEGKGAIANATRIRAALQVLVGLGLPVYGEGDASPVSTKSQVSEGAEVKEAAISEAELMEFEMLSAVTIHGV